MEEVEGQWSMVKGQSSKLLTLENEKKTVFLLHFTHLFDFDSRAVEDTSVRENSKFFWFSSHLIVPLQLFLEKGPNEGDRATSITTVSARPCEDIDARQFPTITEKMVHGFLLP